jgi:ECF transporter S component (folate family)
MKIFLKLSIIVVIFAAFCLPISAKEAEDYISDFEEIMPSDIKDRIGDDGDVAALVGFEALISELVCTLDERRGEIFSFLLLLIGGVVLCGVTSMLENELSSVCEAGVGAVFSLLVFSRLGRIFVEVSEGLSALSGFFTAFVPIAVGTVAASGGVSTALVQHSGMNITLWLLSTVGNPFFTSVVGLGLAASLLCGFGDDGALSIARGVKSFFVFCVGTVSAILGGVIYGALLYKKKLQIGRVFAAQLLVKVFVNILLNTLWLNMLYGKAFLAILPGRLVSNAVMLPIDTAIMFFMLQAVDRTIRRYFDDNQ